MNPQLEELAALYVLDRLDPGERTAFESRLARDSQLGALVREFEADLTRCVRALPQHQPPPGLFARIEAGLDRPSPVGEPTPVRRTAPRWALIAGWGLAALVAIGVATVAIQSLRPAAARPPLIIVVGLDPGRSTLAELAVRNGPAGADARFIELAKLAERFWEKPQELPDNLGSAGRTQGGYALFDPGSNQGFVAIRQLPVAEPDKRYRLWVIDRASGRTRDAGILPPAGSNGGLYFFTVAPGDETAPRHLDFFVAAEDTAASGSDRPRGDVVLGSKGI